MARCARCAGLGVAGAAGVPSREDPARELKRLRAENERLRHELAAGRANLQELWQAAGADPRCDRVIGIGRCMRSSEAVMGARGPEPHHEAEEIIRGIQAIVAERVGEGRTTSGQGNSKGYAGTASR